MEDIVRPGRDEVKVGRAKITYSYFCTAFPAGTDAQKGWEEVKDRARRLYSQVWFDENPEDEDSLPEFADIRTARNFLHGSGLPFPCSRIFIDDFALGHPYVNITSDSVMISCYPTKNVVQLAININVADISLSTLVYLRQVFCDNPVFKIIRDAGREVSSSGLQKGSRAQGTWAAVTAGSDLHENGDVYVSLEGMFRAITNLLGLRQQNSEQAFLCEINDFGPYGTADEIEEAESKAIYGLISGDEGWNFVPDEVVQERLKQHWGSREFVRLYSFGIGSVLINLDSSEAHEKYIERQHSFGGTYYGGINPYFLLSPNLAGVAHGVLFSMETVLVIKTIVNRIYARQEEFQSAGEHDFGSDLHKTREYRRELIETLRMVENMGISELGELESMMLGCQQITPIIDRLKYLLDLLEAELNLLYSERTNRLVNILTIAGLMLSALSVIAGWVALFG